MKFFVPNLGPSNKNVRKINKQSHACPEDDIRRKPLTTSAYHKVRARGFMQDMEQVDWMDADTEAAGYRRIST